MASRELTVDVEDKAGVALRKSACRWPNNDAQQRELSVHIDVARPVVEVRPDMALGVEETSENLELARSRDRDRLRVERHGDGADGNVARAAGSASAGCNATHMAGELGHETEGADLRG